MNCQSHLYRGQDPRDVTRRWFLQQCAVGLGALALGNLIGGNASAAIAGTNPLAPRKPHFAAKAKRVIYLFQAGGPSHLEMFDNKPELAKWDGKLPPPELLKGYRSAFITPNFALLGPTFKFARHGKSGAELSEVVPHLAKVADDNAIVKSMHTDAFNHAPAQIMMNTGSQMFGRPSFGSWATYGLGSETDNLPAFVVFSTGGKGTSGGASNWSSFLCKASDNKAVLDPADATQKQTIPCSRRSECVYNYFPLSNLVTQGIYGKAPADLTTAEKEYLAGFLGRDRADPSGIPNDTDIRDAHGLYPFGGLYDDAVEPANQNKGRGDGIFPIATSWMVKFWQIEAMLTLGLLILLKPILNCLQLP